MLKSFPLFLTILLVSMPTIALSQSAPAINPDKKSYKVIVKESQHCLDVSGLENARVIKSKCNNVRGQGWAFVGIGLSQYQIKSHNNNMCLEVAGSSLADEASLQQFPCGDGTKRNQHWTLKQTTDGKHEIISVSSGKCLNVLNDDHINGGQAVQFTCNQAANQAMILEEIPTPAGVDLNPTAVASAEPIGSGGSASSGATPVYTPGSLLPVTGTDSTWGQPNANIKVEVLFETPEYTQQADYNKRIDVFSGFDLTPVTHYKGNTYFVWVDTYRRPQITKIDGTGTAKTMPIDHNTGYKQVSNGHGRFSVGIDTQGYIHVIGDMQNYTADGAKYAKSDAGDTYPAYYHANNVMYWKSIAPESIDAFDSSIAKEDSATSIPGTGWQHGRFFTDTGGTLYLSGRVKAIRGVGGSGEYGMGVYRYNPADKSWVALGAEPPHVKGDGPYTRYYKVAMWDNQPDFQGYLTTAKLDHLNRLHVADCHTKRLMYGMSSDGGHSWTKANGAATGVPISVTTGAGDMIDLAEGDLHATVVTDKHGHTGAMCRTPHDWRVFNGSSWTGGEALKAANANFGAVASNGALVFTSNWTKFLHAESFEAPIHSYDMSGFDRFGGIDEYGLRTTGVVYGIAFTKDARKQVVLRITAK